MAWAGGIPWGGGPATLRRGTIYIYIYKGLGFSGLGFRSIPEAEVVNA